MHLGPAALVLACTVCYGDPESPMSKGAIAGVVLLGGVILGVLVAFASLFLHWRRRAAAIARGEAVPVSRIVVPQGPAPAP